MPVTVGLWSELVAYGLGVGFSPLHIGLILLLLLGEHPLRRAGLLVLSWFATTALIVLLMLSLGHGLLLPMQQGSAHRTGLDLLAAGALLALGLSELSSRERDVAALRRRIADMYVASSLYRSNAKASASSSGLTPKRTLADAFG